MQKPFLRYFLLFACLLVIPSDLFCQIYRQEKTPGPLSLFKPMNPYHDYGHAYLSVGGGMAAWYRSNQEGFEKNRLPFHFILEYGRTRHPWSIIAGAGFLGEFRYDIFTLNPNQFYLALQLKPFRQHMTGNHFDVYIFGGGTATYSRFSEESYDQIQGYTHKVERKIRPGITVGAGLGYRRGPLEIQPVFQWCSGEAEFLAGHFDRQTFGTGSYQVHILLKYRFVFNPLKNACPVYK